MPNFLIIGAEKCGTTALYHYLRQHPQVYMSPSKETGFFGAGGKEGRGPAAGHLPTKHITDIDDYRALFRGVSGEIAIGEASPYYMYSARALGRIRQHIPDAKLIAILRDPAERAYSNYLHAVWLGREPLPDFAQAIRHEDARVRDDWESLFHYRRKGLYHEQLKRYYDTFGGDQIRVYLQEDLKRDPTGTMQDVFRFLSVNEGFVTDVSVRYNVSGVPKNAFLHALVTGLNRPSVKRFLPKMLVRGLREPVRNRILVEAPRIPAEVRKELVESYKEDVLRLEDLIQRDLSNWLK